VLLAFCFCHTVLLEKKQVSKFLSDHVSLLGM